MRVVLRRRAGIGCMPLSVIAHHVKYPPLESAAERRLPERDFPQGGPQHSREHISNRLKDPRELFQFFERVRARSPKPHGRKVLWCRSSGEVEVERDLLQVCKRR